MNWNKKYEVPWTFKAWLLNFKGVDLPIGDLAEDVSTDASFPDDDFGEILEHLIDKSRNDSEVLQTFYEAWSFYQLSTK
jgi:hypothetical protein